MILAVGNAGAYETDTFQSVLRELHARGESALLFKQDRCLEGETLSFEIHEGASVFSVQIDNTKYNIDEFSAIWYMHPHLPRKLMVYEPADYRYFLHRQFQDLRQSLWDVCRSKIWLNDPISAIRAESKIFQLHVATLVGLKVPETIITSDPDTVRQFYAEHPEGIIVKLLASSPIVDRVIYTNRVTPVQLTQIDSVRRSPSIFQSLVAKAYELRITVVGEKIFSTKINSQVDVATSLDWRHKPLVNDYSVNMESTVIPTNVVEKLRELMKHLGLRFGCIDMIVTLEGEYVFLEINPNGQWYFVQLNTGQMIASAIADILTGSI